MENIMAAAPKPKSDLAPAQPPKETGLSVITPISLPEWLSAKGGPTFLTTIPISQSKGFALANRASVAKDRRIVDEVNMVIAIRDFFLSPYDGVDEDTGEPVSGVRIALIDSEGLVHVTYSAGIRRSLLLLMSRFGSRTWDPPVKVKIASTPAKVGVQLYLDLQE
jgi:hypothetical protein